MTGISIGIIGLALCVISCGIGSGLGLRATTNAAMGVLSEDPNKFSKVMPIALLPATQGIYGFIIAVMGASSLVAGMEVVAGLNVLYATLPMTIGGTVSAILQGNAAATTILALGKKEEIGTKSLLFPAMVEFYALLGLVVSIILIGALA
ncbi:MAG: V-type ATP synthase subunit K [Clostridia bacterium]|nr:V-type ATP synthase subunit K [Clostridia bacterium]